MYKTTAFFLAAQFGGPLIRLSDICEQYLGLTNATATDKPGRGTLEIPVFQLRDSQKAPWIVHLEDLAQYIDQQQAKAREDFRKLRS